MWINTEAIKKLMNGELDDWEKTCLNLKIQAAEVREKEERQRRIAERISFYQKVCDLLAECAPNAASPTDLQFMYYRKYHEQISCSKIADACGTLHIYTDFYQGLEAEIVPAVLRHVYRMPSEHGKSKRTYYKWEVK